mmetsp:Transcript_14114/g.23362  ORF Transcript_14114/g.23362 Transcript_14114/m.23362 type:complete len:123 (-) Transcript_14114:24-392(-)
MSILRDYGLFVGAAACPRSFFCLLEWASKYRQGSCVAIAKGIGFFRSVLMLCGGEKAYRLEAELSYHLRREWEMVYGEDGMEIEQVCLNRKSGGGSVDSFAAAGEVGLLLLIGNAVEYHSLL